MEPNKEPQNKPLHLWPNHLQHHWVNGHEFEQAPGVGDGQGSLAYCSPQGHKELDATEQLNWTDLQQGYSVGKGIFPNLGTWKIGYPHAKEWR